MADAVSEDIDSLKTCLLLLEDESEKDELRSALDILFKVHQNLLKNPGEEKYRQLRKENKAIKEKLLKFDGAKEFLLAAGWTEVDELLMYVDESNVQVDRVLQVIEEKLHTLPPVNNIKPVVETHSSWSADELRRKEQLIEEDKKRRMEEYKRVKKEKAAIKQQIQADRKDSNSREVKESHATNLNCGTFKKFENK
ncbi:UBX domain-containing protein 6-like isoform X2 [Gigantopelta aegis]|nr:UBX domain-containing protein 6-like isoform X2 [Gigantopelta aegis]